MVPAYSCSDNMPSFHLAQHVGTPGRGLGLAAHWLPRGSQEEVGPWGSGKDRMFCADARREGILDVVICPIRVSRTRILLLLLFYL